MRFARTPFTSITFRRHRALFLGLVALLLLSSLEAKNLRLEKCPVPVQITIQQNLRGGEVDKIKEIKIGDYSLYLVELDRRGFKDTTLYISGDGTLRKIVEEIRFKDLPLAVQSSVLTYVNRKGKVEDVERVLIQGNVLYQVEIEPPKGPDQVLLFEPDGSLSNQK